MSGPILLIGGTSPIGRAVASELRGAHATTPADVVVTTRTPTGGVPTLELTSPDSAAGVVTDLRPSIMIVAASPNASQLDADPELALAALEGYRRITEAALSGGARSVVLISSAAVYGTQSNRPRTEDDVPHPEGAYGRFKLAAEAIVAAAAGDRSLSLRLFNVYGPGMRTSLVNRLLDDRGPVPELFDTRAFVRDYVHVADVASGIAMVATSAVSGILNVGTGHPVNNHDLMELPGTRFVARPVEPGFSSHCVAETTRWHSVTGATAPRTVSEAISDSTEW